MTMQLDPSFGKLTPYIPLSGYGQLENANRLLLQGMLKNTVMWQLDYAKSKLKLQEFNCLPKPIESLAQENNYALGVVFNMLNAFECFMKDDKHDDIRLALSNVFDPIIYDEGNSHCVTSPALLVIHSILFSHCDSREETTDQYSAVRTYEELYLSGFSEADCRFIAAIIAHQTLLRSAWTADPEKDPPEVVAYYQDKENEKLVVAKDIEHHSMVGLALQKTLFTFLDENADQLRKQQLAQALILHCLCLQCRHSHFAADSESFSAIKTQALGFSYHLLASSSRPALGLAFFHYLRYANQYGINNNSNKLYKKILEWFEQEQLPKLKNGVNFTLCFPHVPSKQFWLKAEDKTNFDNLAKCIKPSKTNWTESLLHTVNDDFLNLISAIVGSNVWRYYIKEADFLLQALGLNENKIGELEKQINNWLETDTNISTTAKFSIWQWLFGASTLDETNNTDTLKLLGELFKAVSDEHILKIGDSFKSYSSYFPTPQIGHTLRQLHFLRPNYFVPLHIICRDIDTGHETNITKKLFTIWLPKEISWWWTTWLDKFKNLSDDEVCIWDGCGKQWQDYPEILIARYVAAMVITRAVSFAPREIGLDYYSEDTRNKWGMLIDRAISENGGHVMQIYSTMLNCKPSRFYRYNSVPNWLNTSTVSNELLKETLGGKYFLGIDIGGTSIKLYKFSLEELYNCESDKKPIIDNMPISNCSNVTDFINLLFNTINWRTSQECVAIGISLAAPVDKNTGVPIATSGALGKYFSAETEIIKANPIDLHNIDLAQAIKNEYPELVVNILNDGDADIKDSSNTRSQLKEGVSVVVKAGTGVALAVFEDGKLVEYRAESAKSILNLSTTVQQKTINERFPQGVMGGYCSQNALLGLMKDLEQEGINGKVFNNQLCLAFGKTGENEIANIALTPKSKIFLEQFVGEQEKRLITLYEASKNAEGNSEKFGKTFKDCEDSEKIAVAISYILGQWLADAIALVVDIYGARAVQLGGGPLSGYTGIFVTTAAKMFLEESYGFDIQAVLTSEQYSTGLDIPTLVGRNKNRDLKSLRLIYPPLDSGIGGARGAAKAALEKFIQTTKYKQLLDCRDYVVQKINSGDIFSAEIVLKKVIKPKLEFISEAEVENMLVTESMSLNLVRTERSTFKKL